MSSDGLVRPARTVPAVGLANTALSYVVYVALVHVDVPAPVAGAVAFAAGAVQGYVFNGRWTFSGHDTGRQRFRYLLVQLAGAGTTSGVVWVATTAGVPRTAAYLVAVPPVTLTHVLPQPLVGVRRSRHRALRDRGGRSDRALHPRR